MKTRIGAFEYLNDDSIAYEAASLRYRKFLWWDIPIERVIEHPAVAKFKQERRNMVLEKDIEAKVCAFAKSHDMLAYKFTSPQRRSVRLRATGVHVFVVDEVDEGKRIVGLMAIGATDAIRQ